MCPPPHTPRAHVKKPSAWLHSSLPLEFAQHLLFVWRCLSHANSPPFIFDCARLPDSSSVLIGQYPLAPGHQRAALWCFCLCGKEWTVQSRCRFRECVSGAVMCRQKFCGAVLLLDHILSQKQQCEQCYALLKITSEWFDREAVTLAALPHLFLMYQLPNSLLSVLSVDIF